MRVLIIISKESKVRPTLTRKALYYSGQTAVESFWVRSYLKDIRGVLFMEDDKNSMRCTFHPCDLAITVISTPDKGI